MDLRRMRDVRRRGRTGKAALGLRIAQPALSRQIRDPNVDALVRDVGLPSMNGHIQLDPSRLKSAMCGRLRVGKCFHHVRRLGSVQPCVRPVGAVHMTAGHNALRGSGPGQKPAFDNAMALVGCPDRRIDRLCITCCSPSQPSHHADPRRDLVYAASATGCL